MTGCRLCHGNNILPVMDAGKMPITHRLLDSPDADEEVFPMSFFQCYDCGLVQIVDPIDPEILYRSYNYNFSSWKMEPHLADELDSVMASGPFGAAIEIGCNDGRFLALLRERGIKTCFGVEPNPVSGDMAREKGLTVFSGMVTPEVCEEAIRRHGAFDLVVSRQVIEHVLDLDNFFGCIDLLLAEDGVLFLDMPDFEPSLRIGDCSTLWEEHVSYFTEPVLRHLLRRHGFRPVEMRRYDFSGGSLAVLCRRGADGDAAGAEGVLRQLTETFADRVQDYRERLVGALSRVRASGEEVVLYGVGVRGCAASNVLQLADVIDFAVDDQPERQGKFMPGSRLPIRPWEALEKNAGPLVALLAVNNENEAAVGTRLRNDLNRPVKILSLCAPRDIWADLDILSPRQ